MSVALAARRALERILIAISCGCLTVAGISVLRAASFQMAAGQVLERELVAAPTTAFKGGIIGRLEIPRLQLSVVVMEGDDDGTLERAVGHMRGTALPWQAGNAVLAGHRDTFFRPLKDLREGDEIRMSTVRGTFNYRVTRTQIVEPSEVSVLAPTSTRSLTLVTCYPFVYVGQAPQRFIVHAQ